MITRAQCDFGSASEAAGPYRDSMELQQDISQPMWAYRTY